MTDKDIEIAISRCKKDNCTDCPFYKIDGCITIVDYINRLKAENEELKVAEQCLNALTKCFCTKGDDEE